MSDTERKGETITWAPDGSMVKTIVDDVLVPPDHVQMEDESRARLYRFLKSLIPRAGEVVIMAVAPEFRRHPDPTKLMFAVDEALIPNASVWGYGSIASDAYPPAARAHAIAAAERNVTKIKSNAYELALGPKCEPWAVEWMAWGKDFARRHQLRLMIRTGTSVPDEFARWAVVLERYQLRRPHDSARLNYRELGKIGVHQLSEREQELLRRARNQVGEAQQALATRNLLTTPPGVKTS
jgi:hypothetical protein